MQPQQQVARILQITSHSRQVLRIQVGSQLFQDSLMLLLLLLPTAGQVM